MKRTLVRVLCVFLGFLALYALTAQRGLGWGDSGEFQHRILDLADGVTAGCDSLATAHPLYILFCKLVAPTPLATNLVSAFFGALAVAGFLLCSRNLALTVLFGLSHALWWLSCVTEVYTMSLCFVVFETFFLLRFIETERTRDLVAALFLNGLHLGVHNFALLSLPVYVVVALRHRRVFLPAVAWLVGAGYHLFLMFSTSAAGALTGRYGTEVFGLLPGNWTLFAFNLALAALSFVVPAIAVRLHVKGGGRLGRVPWPVVALLAIHFLFWVRYHIVSQYTFVLPTLFFAYLLLSGLDLRRNRVVPLAAMQLLVPLLAYNVAVQIKVPDWYARHPHRNEAAYFMLPWKFNDDSADRYAAEVGGVWNGYPDCGKGTAE